VTARLLSKRTCIGCDATKKRLQQAHTTAPPTSKWLFSCIVVKSSRLVFWRRRLNEIHRSGNLSFSEEKACFSTHFWEIFTVFPPFSDFLVLSFSSAFRHSSFRCITVSLCLL
jgi:hypothetical protein